MSIIGKLTEGIQARSVANESTALVAKWEATGLLEGLSDDNRRDGMARLLENQAAQLLKEESTMAAGGDVEGFAAVAFPLVRRVFGGLLAQELVSVQPMSLPSGLIFFMDFTYKNGDRSLAGAVDGESVYGGGRVAKGILDGISLTGIPTATAASNLEKGFRSLNGGFAHASAKVEDVVMSSAKVRTAYSALSAAEKNELRNDPDLAAAGATLLVSVKIAKSSLPDLDESLLSALEIRPATTIADSLIHNGALAGNAIGANQIGNGVEGNSGEVLQVRRLTRIVGDDVVFTFASATAADLSDAFATDVNANIHYPVADSFKSGGATGSVMADGVAPAWPLESAAGVNEIDLKVDSTAVTAVAKKLKAHWSPELAQDLNAYHSVDAEVELTSILSEMIALEIDQEILLDLINGAKCGTFHWSRKPGTNVGRDGVNTDTAIDFTGSVSEWYETLLEVINDLSAVMHRKTLRGGANFLVCSPDVASILEFTSGFRASAEAEGEKGTWGAVKAGSISKKMDIYVDPQFPRQVILVGRRGSGFLESGYVYAPYVPLQVTPTILDPNDFTPRKGVSTRYAKKMVRPDMYGLVIVRDLLMAT